jgi:hypothetical protein
MDTITIIFPEVKIEISISDLTFDTLEKLIFEIMQNIAGQVFAQAITIIDTYLRKNRRKGELSIPVKGRNPSSPVSGRSASLVPVTGIRPVRPVTFWMRPWLP